MSKKGRKSVPPSKPRSVPVLPLITQEEWRLIWIVLDTAIDNGAYDHDPDIKEDYEELRRKVAARGDIR